MTKGRTGERKLKRMKTEKERRVDHENRKIYEKEGDNTKRCEKAMTGMTIRKK